MKSGGSMFISLCVFVALRVDALYGCTICMCSCFVCVSNVLIFGSDMLESKSLHTLPFLAHH
eukprot:m.888755 g.888755  ORF g.888755 m.888755 type:complete len:62 (-) comp23639_c1_seq7:4231-4416(-)